MLTTQTVDAQLQPTAPAHPVDNMRHLRFSFGHIAWSRPAFHWHRSLVERHRRRGFDVESLCLIPDPPGERWTFAELDRRWRRRDPSTLRLRDRLLEHLRDKDVFINYNGANVHPDWLSDFPTFNVYICWDDPESSAMLSEPVAKAYDFAFTGNAACVPVYHSWGCRNVAFLPYGLIESEYDHTITRESILHGERDIDIVFLGERQSQWRRDRLDRLQQEFPNATMRGRGWKTGFLPSEEKLRTYAQAKIGWNLHNSVGPVNLRVFSLLGNGVMQICDNKCRLGSLFQLGHEVVGFDTIDECIELTRYFLEHDEERRRIAARGHDRVLRDYTEQKTWLRLLTTIAPHVDHGHRQPRVVQARPCVHVSQNQPTAWPQIRSLIHRTVRPRVSAFVKKQANMFGYDIRRMSEVDRVKTAGTDAHAKVNRENAAATLVNMRARSNQSDSENTFEPPDLVALTWAVATHVGRAKRVVEIGGSTGLFAYEAAADPTRTLICSDMCAETAKWARRHRRRPNVEYVDRAVARGDGPFDLVVSIQVIQYVPDYAAFLQNCATIAPRALLATENCAHYTKADTPGLPEETDHAREWTAGELFWVLRTFYEDVSLYAMGNRHIPQLVPVDIVTRLTPIVADCRRPRK